MYLRSLLDYEPEWATKQDQTVSQIAHDCHIATLWSQVRRTHKQRQQDRTEFAIVAALVIVAFAVFLYFAF